jgi:hypothetical protein
MILWSALLKLLSFFAPGHLKTGVLPFESMLRFWQAKQQVMDERGFTQTILDLLCNVFLFTLLIVKDMTCGLDSLTRFAEVMERAAFVPQDGREGAGDGGSAESSFLVAFASLGRAELLLLDLAKKIKMREIAERNPALADRGARSANVDPAQTRDTAPVDDGGVGDGYDRKPNAQITGALSLFDCLRYRIWALEVLRLELMPTRAEESAKLGGAATIGSAPDALTGFVALLRALRLTSGSLRRDVFDRAL